jgi:putative transposase
MPRVARSVVAGYPLHVVQRGINRAPCFTANGDYASYLRFLGSLAAQFECAVHAYCLMTNHVHLLLTPASADGCALLMKNLGQRYVQWLNHRLGRSGTLWGGRFYSCIVNTDHYLLACYRYIELNPVRAGIVLSPDQYPWSSYAANAEGATKQLIRPHAAYEALGVAAYKSLCESAPPADLVEEIRKATQIGCVAGARRRLRGRPWKSQMRKMGSVPI